MSDQENLMTVLTTNIIDYVSLCERLLHTNMMDFLNEKYYALIHREVLAEGGRLDIVYSDRQTAYWSDSEEQNGGYLACRAACSIAARMKKTQSELPPEERFDVTISIATGEAIVVKGSVVGGPVNLCYRMLDLCKEFRTPILIDETTYRATNTNLRNLVVRRIDAPFGTGQPRRMLYELVECR